MRLPPRLPEFGFPGNCVSSVSSTIFRSTFVPKFAQLVHPFLGGEDLEGGCVMYPGIELRPLRYVIAVAQERHFARAALRVHVARSSLSKSIRDIEDYVGVPLFERTTREVELTPAGRAFIEDGARALTYAERAIHRARAANGTNNGSLSIGYSPRINLQLLSIIRELAAAQRPAANVAFVSLHTPDQLRALHEGAIQIGLVTLPLRDEFLALKTLLREPLGVVFPSCHRLARGGDIDPKELNGLPVVVTNGSSTSVSTSTCGGCSGRLDTHRTWCRK